MSLTSVFRRHSRITEAMSQTRDALARLTRERAEAARRLEGLRAARAKTHTQLFDDKAKLLITEADAERRHLDEEIADLAPQLPTMDQEIADLEGEILPRLAREMARAERDKKLDIYRGNETQAQAATRRPDDLVGRWNEATATLTDVLTAMAAENGKISSWTEMLRADARPLKVELESLPPLMPIDEMLDRLQQALHRAWQAGFTQGEEQAGAAYLNESQLS